MGCEKIRGARRRRPRAVNCATALTPMRFHWGFRSGRSSKRAETLFLVTALVAPTVLTLLILSFTGGGVALRRLGAGTISGQGSVDFGLGIGGAIPPGGVGRKRMGAGAMAGQGSADFDLEIGEGLELRRLEAGTTSGQGSADFGLGIAEG